MRLLWGTEHYFGYIWSTPERFVHALHAQTRAGTRGFDGAFSMNRFHIVGITRTPTSDSSA